MKNKDINHCHNCGSYIKNHNNSLHVWNIEYKCGCEIYGAIDTKSNNDEIQIKTKCPK